MTDDSHWPTELRCTAQGSILRATFADGAVFDLPAEYLRVESPSAEVRGHGVGDRKIESGKRRVAIRGVEPMGNYAVRLVFDDGHATGIFTWSYLRQLGTEHEDRWAAYLRALSDKGLSR